MLPDKIKEKISEIGTDFNKTHMYCYSNADEYNIQKRGSIRPLKINYILMKTAML